MNREAYVYFMTNRLNNVLYVGVTTNIIRRVAEHKAKTNDGFTKKYNCIKLVYFETAKCIDDAISREKQLKNWQRAWKNELIESTNPHWEDLGESIGVTAELVQDIEEIARQARNDESITKIKGD